MEELIKNIDVFKYNNEFTKPQKNRIKSFKEIYKTYKKLNWDDYKDGFDSVGDFLHKLIDDTPEVRKGLVKWVKTHKKDLVYKKWRSTSENIEHNLNNIIIMIDTQEDYHNLMKYLEIRGYSWGGIRASARNYFKEYTNFCVSISGDKYLNYAYYEWYKSHLPFKNYNFINSKNLEKIKKIENPEIDPYGEEDWGYDFLD